MKTRLRSLLGLSLLGGPLLGFGLAPTQAWGLEFELIEQGLLGDDFANLVRNEESYARDFIALTAAGMMEQSFVLQHNSVHASAALPGANGLQVGLTLVTFPLAPPQTNLLGKEENTQYSPVLPRVMIGYSGGDTLTYGAAYSLVPPISVGGGSALVHGLEASVGYTVQPRLRVGLEADVSFGRAIAPVTVPKAAYEAAEAAGTDEFANVDPVRYEEVCAPQEYGCLDTLNILHGTLRAVASFPISTIAQPYVRLGVEGVNDTFAVEIDLSEYRLSGLIPQLGIGTQLQLHPRMRAGVGALMSVVPPVLDGEAAQTLFRLELGGSWVF